MKNINDAIKVFMKDLAVYDNPHDVEIVLNEDDSVIVAATWPGEDHEGFNLEFCFESNTLTEFTQAFEIQSPEGLTQITPAIIINLYQQGKASVYCAVDNVIGSSNYYPLYFRKKNNSMRATDGYGNEHQVLVLLETPEQFIEYTKERYLLSKVLPETHRHIPD